MNTPLAESRGLGRVLAHADRLRSGRTPFVLATVVRARRPTSARPGDRALVLPDGTVEGFVGGDCAEDTVRDQGLRLLAAGQSGLLRITPASATEAGEVGPDEDVITVDNPCLSGGMLEIFLEAMVPPPLVVVLGTSPVAQALGRVGAALGYDVRLTAATAGLADGADAVVLASHGRGEREVLRAAIAAHVPYVALVASQRRGEAVLASLRLPAEETAQVSTPAGLDIGARSPGEIAVSVYAELIARRRSASARGSPTPAERATRSVPVAHGECCQG